MIGGEESLLSACFPQPPILVLLRNDFNRLTRSKGYIVYFLLRGKWSTVAQRSQERARTAPSSL